MVQMKNLGKKRQLLAFLLIVSALFLISAHFYVYETRFPQTAKWAMEKTCSFQIFTDATTIYAQNCGTGGIDYSGTDAATVVNNAIGALTKGGIVHVKAGTYQLSRAVVGSVNDIVLEGEGRSTVFTVASGWNPANGNPSVAIGPTGNGWVLRNFKFDGTNMVRNNNNHAITARGNNTTITGLYVINWDGVGVGCSGGNRCIISNNILYGWNSGDGISVGYATDAVVANNIVQSVTNYNGIVVAGSANVTVSGNLVNGAGNGIGLENIGSQGMNRYVSIVGNVVRNTTTFGIGTYAQNGGVDSAQYVAVTGNTVISSGVNGIKLLSGKYITISSNVVVGTGQEGIAIAGSTVNNVQIIGNTIQKTGTSGNGIGIHLGGGSDYIISGNVINATTNYGIGFDSGANITMTNNEILYPVGRAISCICLRDITISNNMIRVNNAFGARGTVISLFAGSSAVTSVVVTGNQISGSGVSGTQLYSAGIYLSGGAGSFTGGIISNNLILGDVVAGIFFSNSVSNFTVTGNLVRIATNGIQESGPAADYNLFVANYFQKVTNPIVFGATPTHSQAFNNMGYNPRAAATITVRGSPYTYTNNDGYPELVVVSGGTVSDISYIRGAVTTGTGLTDGTFLLYPSDSLKVTYTGIPTMVKFPQ